MTLSNASSRLNLRASASTASAIVDKLRDGDYVEILADKGGWARVETVQGKVGYVQTHYLRQLEGIVVLPTTTATPAPTATATPTATPGAPSQGASYARVSLSSASSRLNLRSSPSTSSAIVATLDHGKIVRVLAASGSWVRVETASGQTGYVQSRYLAPIDGAVATPAPTATAAPTATPAPDAGVPQDGDYARVRLSSASSRLNLRASASTSSAIVAKLGHGETVRVLAASGSWVRVETASGQTGYVQSRYLEPADGAVTTPAPTVTAAPTATPAPDVDVPQDGGYARVRLSSASSRLNLRASASTSSAIVAKLGHGETVRVLAVSGSWVRVETASGQTGYVQSRYLEPADGAVATPAPTATAAPTATPAPDTGEMTEMDGEVYADIYVSASGGSLHVRQGPSTQTPSVTTVSHGSWVQVLAVGGEWARCAHAAGQRRLSEGEIPRAAWRQRRAHAERYDRLRPAGDGGAVHAGAHAPRGGRGGRSHHPRGHTPVCKGL